MRYPIAAAVLAATLCTGASLPAAAQAGPSFCSSALKSISYHSNVVSAGDTAEVEYSAQFLNSSTVRQLTVMMSHVASISRSDMTQFPVIRQTAEFHLAPNEQRTIKLLAVRVDNATGAGAPPPNALTQLRFTCPYYSPPPRPIDRWDRSGHTGQ